jgi:cation diffusion facilitator family transporter
MASTAQAPRPDLDAPPDGRTADRRSKEKRGVAFVSFLAAAAMALLKLAVGLWTGSLGMLSEAAHSGIDCSAALLTLLSVRVSDKPADADHPYGHGKIENVSAFVQTFLMVGSALWISVEAVKRLWHHDEPLRLSVWPFAVLLLSIAVDVSRARKLKLAAEKHGSAALAADAVHFRMDVLTSIAVLGGLLCVWAAHHFGVPSLAYADSVAALLVAAVILGIAWQLARRTVDQLIDVVPEAERTRIIEELSRVPGVLSVDRVRLRKSGNRFYTDISLGMARTLTFQRSEQLVHDATLAVQRVLPESDVVVTPLPRASRAESIFDRVRAVASRHNVSIHDLSVQEFDGSLRAELHLEVIESMPLREAHDFVSSIEAEILSECPELASVLTHIESEPAQIEHPQIVERDDALEEALRLAAGSFPQIEDVHDVTVRRVGEHTYVSCHCTLPDEMPMVEVHAIITDLEGRFKQTTPGVTRVFIHPEPATDNRR